MVSEVLTVIAKDGATVFQVDEHDRPILPLRVMNSRLDIQARRTADDKMIARSPLYRAAIACGDLGVIECESTPVVPVTANSDSEKLPADNAEPAT